MSADAASAPLLEVEHLRVSFRTEDGVVQAVDDVSFTLAPGEVLAVVRESGSGKSVTGMTLMGLTRSPNARIEGSARLRGHELLTASGEQMRGVRGEEIAMIFQDPMTALNPVHRVGQQIVEQIRAHDHSISKAQGLDRAIELMERAGIPRAAERVKSYPHEFSGGMRQRVMIAMALINDPKLLIADEPTTALDVTVQAQILELIDRVKTEFDIGVILITHDLGVIADVAQTVMVMYAGRAMEQGPKEGIFDLPLHPYTWGLLESIPNVDQKGSRLVPIEGSPPSLIRVPPGCPFHPRCPHRFSPCDKERPDFVDRGGGHPEACHLTIEDKKRLWNERESTRVKVAV